MFLFGCVGNMYSLSKQNFLLKLFVTFYVEHLWVKVVTSQFSGKIIEVCITDACYRTAEKMRIMMKEAVNPCDNFYHFACGGYLELADLTANMTSYNTDLDESQMEKVIIQIKDELEKPSSGHELKPFRLAKKLYQQCIESDALGKQEVGTVKKYFKLFGGWPVLEGAAWDQKNISWIDVNTKFYENGFFSRGIFTTKMVLNPSNTSQYLIQISLPKLGIKDKYLLPGFRGSIVKAYHKYMTQVAVIFGANRTQAQLELKEVLRFEIQLAKIINAVDKFGPVYNVAEVMTLSEINSKYPYVPVEDILVKTFQIQNEQNISGSVINVHEAAYFARLGKVLRRTNNRVVINYLFWRAIDGVFGDIPLLNTTEYLRMLGKIHYAEIDPPKNEMCTELLNERMKIAVGALYARKYSSKVMKSIVSEMSEKLRRELINLIASLDWVDVKAREKASAKVRNIDILVAYPDEFLDDSKLEAYYEKLHLPSEDSFVENLLAVNKFSKKMSFSTNGTYANRTDWRRHDSITSIYALYKPEKNSVFIPAALLQEYYIHVDRPAYLNYGALASLIGHEVLHSLDTDGQLRDEYGNSGKDLFNEMTKRKYEEKTIALSNHYSSYMVKELKMKLDGFKTEEENIMDQGGLKIAYASYKNWVNNKGEEPLIPYMEKYTATQLFWVSFANTHCARMSPRELKNELENDEHPPAEFRVNVPLRNLEYFASDFHCPDGSFMNPPVRYNVW